jgi:ADP-heptose:LPS heptosyltransferase
MIADRLRSSARLAWLGVRAFVLLTLGLLRRRVRRLPAPSGISRILAIRCDRLGDMALTTPALSDLKEHFRRAEITVLAPAAPLALLEGHPAVHHRVALSGRSLPADLAGRFDLVIDFTPDEDLRGARLARATRSPLRAGFRAFGRQAFFSLRGPRAHGRRHVVDLNRDLMEALGIKPGDRRPELHVTREERGHAQARLAALGAAAPRVAVHPGGHYPSQRWPAERFAELVTALTGQMGAACIVVAGPDEQDLVERICAATPDALAMGPLGVREMMAVFSACDLFVGNNSGPLHVASALGLPTVSVMGPTDPLRFAPRGPADRVVRRDLPCSPCQRGRCWHHTCLRSIEPGEIVAQAEAVVAALLPQQEAR